MKTRTLLISSLFAAAVAFAQSPEKTKSAPASANFPPIGDIHAHVCGIHFYSGDISRQIIAEHYCSHLSDEVLQCILYDSNKPGAKMIGVEYIVSAKIFETLPAEEKKLWHSHNYEVKSGVLTAPGMADADENGLLKVLIGTYGKTWQTWQIDKNDKIPMGIPQLMMAFTKDGQAKAVSGNRRESVSARLVARGKSGGRPCDGNRPSLRWRGARRSGGEPSP